MNLQDNTAEPVYRMDNVLFVSLGYVITPEGDGDDEVIHKSCETQLDSISPVCISESAVSEKISRRLV